MLCYYYNEVKLMRLIFIRHREPDYRKDSLTTKGIEEARLLKEYLKRTDLGEVYVSPLGRAALTAQIARGEDYDLHTAWWLEEIGNIVDRYRLPELQHAYRNSIIEKQETHYITWDIMPSYLYTHPEYIHPENWRNGAISVTGKLGDLYDKRTGRLDDLLARHGYHRDGNLYKTEQGNHDTLTFFCHLGIGTLLISHLINVSPFALWHGFAINTSSITEIYTEEREKGTVIFRISRMGDISHLSMRNEEPSFNARFCEVFEDDTRH